MEHGIAKQETQIALALACRMSARESREEFIDLAELRGRRSLLRDRIERERRQCIWLDR